MKNLLPSLLAATFFAPAAFAQKPGDTVTPDALGKLEWITGAAPTTWEPGKVYILECWATWCAPCLAAIPHVDELYDKYEKKGLRVLGINVREDDKEKVANFVKTKGDGMSYPVAFNGKEGAFESEWLKPAEAPGIPFAFVVKDGKVLLNAHPIELTEPVIEGLLAGGEEETRALAAIRTAQKTQEDMMKLIAAFRKATSEKNIVGMEQAITELKALIPTESRDIAMMEFEVLLAKKEWASVEAELTKLEADPILPRVIFGTGRALVLDPDSPVALRKSIYTRLAADLEKKPNSFQMLLLSKLQWSLGEKEEAIAIALRAAELAKTDPQTSKLPTIQYDLFAEALKKGEVSTDEQLQTWFREALQARKAAQTPDEAAPPAPAIPATPR